VDDWRISKDQQQHNTLSAFGLRHHYHSNASCLYLFYV
jgi:hypothetical protein